MLNKILCGATLLCAAGFANAASISFSQDVLVDTTNYTTSVDLSKFDTMGGTRVLESVTFSIAGSISGSAELESRDAQAATIEYKLESELTLTDALMNTLVVSIPSLSDTFLATAYDGVLDSGGTSGASFFDLSASQYAEQSFNDAATLAMFTGSDFATFAFDANATSAATGAGNLVSSFNTSAGGLVSVVYTYSDVSVPVSAPAHLAALGLGLLAFAGVRKSRK
jgi:hypothetical protein